METKLRVVAQRDNATVEALYDLLAKAHKGEIIGLAYVALKPGCDYSGGLVGIARQNEILARGVVSTLWDQIPRLKLK